MYCPKCGVQNDDNASVCVSCGYVLNSNSNNDDSNLNSASQYSNQNSNAQMPANIPSYLAFSILTTLFCCLPTGIVGIIFSSQVDSKLRTGDVNGAMESSKKAKMWCWISFGLGIACYIIAIISFIAFFGLIGLGISEYGY